MAGQLARVALIAIGLVMLRSTVSAQNPGQTLLTTQAPDTSPATLAWELGTRMSADVSGQIMSVRYYRMAGDTGAHVGRIWTAAGVSLATVPIVAQATTGWQEQALTAPLPIAAGVSWVVSVDSPNGVHYGKTAGQFPLTAGHLAGVTGTYGPLGVFPGLTTPTGYYRDVRFVADAIPTIAISADGTPGGYTALTAGFPAGAYTLTVTLRDATGAVVAASAPVVVGP